MTTVMTMPTVSKAVLKARLLEYLRDVEESGEPIIVTNYGTPVARITRIRAGETVDDLFESARGALRFTGDPNEPTADEWRDA
jgi:prevent-host-death family protein